MSEKSSYNRRDFLKLAGLAGIALPTAKVIGSVGGMEVIESPDEYGGFHVRRHELGNPPYSVDDNVWKRPDFAKIMQGMFGYAKNPFLYNQNKEKHIRNNDPGFTRLDYAFEDAAFTFQVAAGNSGLGCKGFQSWERLEREDLLNPIPMKGDISKWDPAEGDFTTEDVSIIVKKAAKFLGASLAGIARVDERWFYESVPVAMPKLPEGANVEVLMAMMEKMLAAGKKMPAPPIPQASQLFNDTDKPKILEDGTRVIPKSMKWAVVMAFEMDYDAIECELSPTSNAAVADGYSRMAITTASLAEFFRGMGYNAIPLGNDTALSIPMAIDAGLGELGRNGVVITPKYGPRVRLAKVVTDMPLIPDKPISFGVTEFCEVCKKCADHCPSDALAQGPLSYDVPGDSGSNPGVLKWASHGGKCFGFWNENGVSCSNCIRVCPFNKPEGWHHQLTRLLIGGVKSKDLDKLLVKLDDASGYGGPLEKAPSARKFWSIDRFRHIKS